MCRTWGSNSGPLACQANSLPIELPRPVDTGPVDTDLVFTKRYPRKTPILTSTGVSMPICSMIALLHHVTVKLICKITGYLLTGPVCFWFRMDLVCAEAASSSSSMISIVSPFTFELPVKQVERWSNEILLFVCSGLMSLSTIFQSLYHDGVWLQQRAQCSLF